MVALDRIPGNPVNPKLHTNYAENPRPFIWVQIKFFSSLHVSQVFIIYDTLDNMGYMPYILSERSFMRDFTVLPYEKENGEAPVEDFLNSLDVKMRAKMFGMIGILQEKGNDLREPYSKPLGDGIFELRCQFGNNITRVLYFFYYERRIILTNGFIKKTQKTPPEEIKLAKQRRADYIRRMNKS